MKKAIIVTVAMFSFLIGCSFSKKEAHKPQASQQKQHVIEDIFDVVQYAGVDDVIQELKKYSAHDLTTLTKNGRSLLDIAVIRGSNEVASALVSAGASPYYPNSKGISLYNSVERFQNPVAGSISLSAFNYSFTEIAANLENNRDNLISQINNYTLPCDLVIQYIIGKYDVTSFASEISNCSVSFLREHAADVFITGLRNYLGDKQISPEEFESILKIIPKDYQYNLISLNSISNLTSWDYGIHPLVLVDILAKFYPEKFRPLFDRMKDSYPQSESAIVLLNPDRNGPSKPLVTIEQYFQNKSLYSELPGAVKKSLLLRVQKKTKQEDSK